MLIKPTISNEECREFLLLKDKYAANYVLKKLQLKRNRKIKGINLYMGLQNITHQHTNIARGILQEIERCHLLFPWKQF